MTESLEQQAKKPGRPPLKKGKPTWKPANVADIEGKEPGYRYRKIRKDPNNIAAKQLEGWELVSDVNGQNATAEAGYGRINDGKALTTVREGTDWVLGRMPEELGQARDEYINEKTRKQTIGLTAGLKKEIAKDAPVHGDITISSLREQQVIK